MNNNQKRYCRVNGCMCNILNYETWATEIEASLSAQFPSQLVEWDASAKPHEEIFPVYYVATEHRLFGWYDGIQNHAKQLGQEGVIKWESK